MTATERAERLSNSVWFTVAARASMLAVTPLFCAMVWFGHAWLDQRFDDAAMTAANATSAVSGKVDNLNDKIGQVPDLKERVIVLETNQKRSQTDREDFQKQTFARLDRMQDAIVTLSNTVAGLTATIQAQEDRQQGR